MRILLAEDDFLLGDGIRAGLVQEGYTVDWFKDGEEVEAALRSEEYELVILDLGLPRRDGLMVLEGLRARGVETPVLILTARDTVADRVKGLDRGADDYMIKPFDLDELSARMRSLLRRSSGRATPTIVHGDIELDPVSHAITRANKTIELSPREFTLLRLLLEHRGQVMSRNRLEDGLYSWESEIESNAIEVYIHHLRRKLGAELIRTIRGVGYIIDTIDA